MRNLAGVNRGGLAQQPVRNIDAHALIAGLRAIMRGSGPLAQALGALPGLDQKFGLEHWLGPEVREASWPRAWTLACATAGRKLRPSRARPRAPSHLGHGPFCPFDLGLVCGSPSQSAGAKVGLPSPRPGARAQSKKFSCLRRLARLEPYPPGLPNPCDLPASGREQLHLVTPYVHPSPMGYGSDRRRRCQ